MSLAKKFIDPLKYQRSYVVRLRQFSNFIFYYGVTFFAYFIYLSKYDNCYVLGSSFAYDENWMFLYNLFIYSRRKIKRQPEKNIGGPIRIFSWQPNGWWCYLFKIFWFAYLCEKKPRLFERFNSNLQRRSVAKSNIRKLS